MKIEKLARQMEAWRFGFDSLPNRIWSWVLPLHGDRAVVVSPRAGTAHGPGTRAGIVIETGWWIIEAETGCLYAVTDEDFRKKYRVLGEEVPPTPVPAAPRPGAFH